MISGAIIFSKSTLSLSDTFSSSNFYVASSSIKLVFFLIVGGSLFESIFESLGILMSEYPLNFYYWLSPRTFLIDSK